MTEAVPRPTAGERGSSQVDRIVLEAASLDTVERGPYLLRLGSADPALLEEVERRLDVAASLPEDFLALPAAELLGAVTVAREKLRESDSADVSWNRAEGRYELLEVLGEGGAGTVWSAFDRQLERRVALKFLRGAAGGDRGRFLDEARVQARVRHDHVLEIYDTGELCLGAAAEARPFLSMRWVDGGTLEDLPVETSVEERVRLVRQAAEGLHAAHREGLVHRDVKPSNLLLEKVGDGSLCVRVSDFGIATTAGQGDLVGTPAYLAPELLGGATFDRRVDVYGLGVTLYRLLAGQPPFAGEDLTDLLRRIAREPPPQLPAGMSRDLVAIVYRCLEKDPEARYGSAQELAEDLRRFLDGEPVEAVTSTAAYRFSKFAVRHRRALAAAACVVALLLVASWIAAAMGLEASLANARAQARRGQAEDLISFMLGDLRSKLATVGRLDLLDAVGEKAMDYFAAVPEVELADRELARRSQALYQIGEVRMDQGRIEEALPALRQSLELARKLRERAPADLERLFDLGQSEFWVGHAAWKLRDRETAGRHLGTYFEISERLVREAPTEIAYRMELAYASSNLGLVASEAGRLDEAAEHYRRARDTWSRLSAESPQDAMLEFELAAAHNDLGALALGRGELRAARDLLEQEHVLRMDLAAGEPSNAHYQSFLATSHDYLASVYGLLGDSASSEKHLTACEALFRQLVEKDPSHAEWRFKWGLALEAVARHSLEQDRLETAEAAIRELKAAAETLPDTAGTANVRHLWLRADLLRLDAERRWRRGDPEGALELLAEALDRLGQLAARHPGMPFAASMVPIHFEVIRLSGPGSPEREDRLAQVRHLLAAPELGGRRPWVEESRIRLAIAENHFAEASRLARRLRETGHARRAFWRAYEACFGLTSPCSVGPPNPGEPK